MDTITACITACNEQENIRRCLESVTWADEIVVVDSFSADSTPEICREYTRLVFKHRWLGYIGQKNLARDLASSDWVLFLDADEEISSDLRDEIRAEFTAGTNRDFAGIEFPRLTHFLGRWITHGDWYPDVKLRLYRRNRGYCGGSEPHDRMVVDGPVKRLKHPMFHYTYTSIDDQLATLNRFSSITARTQFEEGRHFRLVHLLFRPFLRFLRGYLLRLGFLDGMPGLIIAMSASYGVFVKYAKLWELSRTRKPDNKTAATRCAGR
jgi:glycosyltransferase involved in cell wall biosynthesis